MAWISPAITGVTALTSLFSKGKSPSNPYLPEMLGELKSEGNEASNLNSLGTSASNTYNQFSPQANQAVEDYSRYLTSNPFTNTVNQALLNRATGSTTAAYQQARAQLAASLAARGLSGSGAEAGALSGLDQSELGTLGAANANLGLQEAQDYGQNLGENVNLLSGAASRGLAGATSAYGDAGRLYGDAASLYAGVGQSQEEDQMRQQQEQNQLESGLGSGLGAILAGTGGKSTSGLDPQTLALIKAIMGGGAGTTTPLMPKTTPTGQLIQFGPNGPMNYIDPETGNLIGVSQ